jgi:predicted GNAT superfamily acetyltransferase
VKPPPFEAPALLSLGAGSEPLRHAIKPGDVPRVTIAVPLDPDAVAAESFELAVRWRETTRAVFLEWIAADYIVTDSHQGQYLLEKKN